MKIQIYSFKQCLNKSAILIYFELVYYDFQCFFTFTSQLLFGLSPHDYQSNGALKQESKLTVALWHRKVDSGHYIFIYFIVWIFICAKNDTVNRRMIWFYLNWKITFCTFGSLTTLKVIFSLRSHLFGVPLNNYLWSITQIYNHFVQALDLTLCHHQ